RGSQTDTGERGRGERAEDADPRAAVLVRLTGVPRARHTGGVLADLLEGTARRLAGGGWGWGGRMRPAMLFLPLAVLPLCHHILPAGEAKPRPQPARDHPPDRHASRPGVRRGTHHRIKLVPIQPGAPSWGIPPQATAAPPCLLSSLGAGACARI